MTQTFQVGIKALIVNNSKALVLKEIDIRDNITEIYDLPGGRIDDKESIEEALTREIKEEIGVTNIKIGKIIFAQKHPYREENGIPRMLLYYIVDVKNPKIKLSDEHISYEWISKKDLESIIKNKGKMHIGIRTALEKVLK